MFRPEYRFFGLNRVRRKIQRFSVRRAAIQDHRHDQKIRSRRDLQDVAPRMRAGSFDVCASDRLSLIVLAGTDQGVNVWGRRRAQLCRVQTDAQNCQQSSNVPRRESRTSHTLYLFRLSFQSCTTKRCDLLRL